MNPQTPVLSIDYSTRRCSHRSRSGKLCLRTQTVSSTSLAPLNALRLLAGLTVWCSTFSAHTFTPQPQIRWNFAPKSDCLRSHLVSLEQVVVEGYYSLHVWKAPQHRVPKRLPLDTLCSAAGNGLQHCCSPLEGQDQDCQGEVLHQTGGILGDKKATDYVCEEGAS